MHATIGGRLQAALEYAAISINELSKRLDARPGMHRKGATRTMIARYRDDEATPPLEFITAVAEITRVRPEWLALNSGEMTVALQAEREAAREPDLGWLDARIETGFPELRNFPESARRVCHQVVSRFLGLGAFLRSAANPSPHGPPRVSSFWGELAPESFPSSPPTEDELRLYEGLRAAFMAPIEMWMGMAWPDFPREDDPYPGAALLDNYEALDRYSHAVQIALGYAADIGTSRIVAQARVRYAAASAELMGAVRERAWLRKMQQDDEATEAARSAYATEEKALLASLNPEIRTALERLDTETAAVVDALRGGAQE